MSGPQIMADLFAMIHKALAFSKQEQVAISLPKSKEGTKEMPTPSLGNLLRLHGAASDLENLLKRPELRTLEDYAVLSPVQPVPRETSHKTVRRIQVKSNPERLLRRSVKKGWLSEEEAAERLKTMKKVRIYLPFIPIRSSSSGHSLKLLIEHGKKQPNPVAGKFSAYGLGIQNEEGNFPTIPWF